MTFLDGGDRNDVLLGANQFAEAHISGGGLITVDTNLVWQAVLGFLSDDSAGITFNAGSTGAISEYTNPGGGQVTVISAGHALVNGDIVTISGTTNYNGIFEVADVVAGTSFRITDGFLGDDAVGTFRNGSNFVIAVDGVYLITWQISASSAAVNKTFIFTISSDATIITAGLQRRKFAVGGDIGAVAGSFVLDCVAGDIVAFNLQNESDANDITISQATFNLHRIS